MSVLSRRFLILIFAMLQCVAPLLHAHTHGESQVGVHVPEWQDGQMDGQARAECGCPDTLSGTIGLAPSLKFRLTGDMAPPPSSLPRPRFGLASSEHVGFVPLEYVPRPALSAHLLPEPCAPPNR